ncbi:uncharacterized aarF domain-containing protein kinase 2 isoform X2 [Xiphophorus couchianus]|uniref:uncharacterized aarF domain-containing protein kinase 2 isoform X2 n=1 Tax=Xiphophorus couchianus TaxID=32473 RepID=UPI0010168E72|nr:uncharacterized aarF domain-containing protein kinase 2 isoform X2 [Xiphophorus couchianus]
MAAMLAFGARGLLVNLRSTLQRAGCYARCRLVHNQRTRLIKRGQILTHIPKVALLCWGAVSASSFAAKCQEATLPPKAADRKSLAKVQVHKVVFFLRLSLRALVLLCKFGPLLLLYPLALMSTHCASYWLKALLWVTETSGPTFIKLGQWASTRRDIFSREFCECFSRLHVKVYRGWARVGQVEDPSFQSIVEEMERKDLLEAWEIPGLGGVGGVLQQAGESSNEKERLIPVAIKVVHPGVRRQVEIDLLLMKAGGWLLHCLPGLKWLSLCEVVEEFEKLMTKQIDLRFEARNIERFQENFRDVESIRFPTPLRPFVTRNILVETFEESEPISNYLSSEIPQEVKQRIARMGVDTLLKMVFVDNFVHGDLHPGNILVQYPKSLAGSSDAVGATGDHLGKTTLTDLLDTVVVSVRPGPCPLQLVLLDAGIVAQLSDHDLANFKAVFTAVVLRKGDRVAELILHHARANECKDVALFKKEMAELVDHAVSNTLSLGKIRVADLLSKVFGLLIKHKVKLESNFASIVFAIMVLEGLGRSLDPDLDILDLAKPLLLKNCASLL